MFASIPLKYISTCNPEVLPEATAPLYEIQYVDIGNVGTDGSITAESMLFGEAPSRARRTVRHGDVVVSTVRTYLRAIAHVEHPPTNMVVSTGFAVLRPSGDVNARFFGYALQSTTFVDDVVAHSDGVSYPAITPQKLVRLELPVPPRATQVAIAAFLDRETAAANALITDYEQLIQLLDERRSALIVQAVTKGLDPNATMKDSGVSWIGEVPEHWIVAPLRRFAAKVLTGGTPSETAFAEQGLSWFTPVAFRDDLSLSAADKKVSLDRIIGEGTRVFPAGSTLVVSIGATLGKVAFTPVACTSNQQINAVIPNDRVDGRYLTFAIHACKNTLISEAATSTLPILNQSRLKDIVLAAPNIAEQRRIVEFLSNAVVTIDEVRTEAQRAIDLVRDRTHALITAAVTGQIDVSAYKSQLVIAEAA